MSKLYKDFLLLILALIMTIFFNGCPEDSPVTSNNPAETLLIDTLINTTNGDVSIEVKDKITILFPKSSISPPSRLKIKKTDLNSAINDSIVYPIDIYNVTIGDLKEFSIPLTISIKYDPTQFPANGYHNEVSSGYFDETSKLWCKFQPVTIDSIKKTVTFSTNHLTKLSWWHLRRLMFRYHNYRFSKHFKIFWSDNAPDKPLSNTEYNHTANWQTGKDLNYVEDLEYYLEEAFNKYESIGLTVPTYLYIDVYIQNMTDNGITEGIASRILVNNKPNLPYKLKSDPSGNPSLIPAQVLPSIAAHELLHWIQDYYYTLIASDKTGNHWLMEALAANADRIIGNSRDYPFEIDCWTSLNSLPNLGNSWDDCNSDPAWYNAGGFLGYLMFFRDGTKISIKDILDETGKNNLLPIRQTLGGLLSKKVGNSIGLEYYNFLKWAYEGKGPIFLPVSLNNPGGYMGMKGAKYLSIKQIDNPFNLSDNMPHLSGKFVQIHNNTTDGNKLKIKVNKQPTAFYNRLYKVDINNPENKTFVAFIENGEKIYDFVPETEGKYRYELLIVNSYSESDGDIDIDITITKDKNNDLIKRLNLTDDVEFQFKANMIITYPSGDPGTYLADINNKRGGPPNGKYSFSGTSFSIEERDSLPSAFDSWQIQVKKIKGTVSDDGTKITSAKAECNFYSYQSDGTEYGRAESGFEFSNVSIYNPNPPASETYYGFGGTGSNLKGNGSAYYKNYDNGVLSAECKEILWNDPQVPTLNIEFRKTK